MSLIGPFEGCRIIACDFCAIRADETEVKLGKFRWAFGNRGERIPFGVSCRREPPEVKHACSDEVCQAKLLAWARS